MLPYGIIGNCKTCALVKKDASIDWMCYPSFSSPSIFAKILDKNGGSLEVHPLGKYKVAQRYIPNTAVLETTFTSQKHAFKIIDFFPRYKSLLQKDHQLLVKNNRLIRIIKPLKGKPKLKISYDPKPNYAIEKCSFKEEENELRCTGFSLASNINFEKIINGEIIVLNQAKYIVVGEKQDSFSVQRCMTLLYATKKYWEKWVETLILPEKHRDAIIRSAIALKLLTYSETGAIIAASTTSIPEELHSGRNFDYRYCWVRDAVFCVDALTKIGRHYEARKLMEFFMKNVLEHDFIQIMYGIHGETNLDERELPHLEGFKCSSPVRIGNAAYNQVQNDIYGGVVDLLYFFFCYYNRKQMTKKYWRFLSYLINQIKFTWHRKDNGIWEFREYPRHYTYSKVMCFVGVDRAIKLAQFYKKDELAEKWVPLRDEIKEDILKHGYNAEVKSFTLYYGGTELDAALLLLAYHEFLEPSDPRLINTVKAIYHGLRKGYLVKRYTKEDDFGMSHSAFTICAFWLIDALYYIGEEKKARILYTAITKRSNHLCLFSEDIDIRTKKQLGNFPQAYTHIAHINSSILLSEWSAKRKRIEWGVKRKEWF